MTLDEAIEYEEDLACFSLGILKDRERKREYLQIAEWLKDYKHLKEQEPCEDCISRSSIKQKLQEHHDFFVNAYGGFSNLPLHDKSRVDELSNCIAMVINEPPVNPQPKTGHWRPTYQGDCIIGYRCSNCESGYSKNDYEWKYCPICGAKMKNPSEVQE